jgi:ABC-type phosphate/phosphonate transport system substrate-binding protein
MTLADASGRPRLVACARMYASGARLSAAWRTLLAHVSERSGVELEMIDHPYPASLDELWDRPDLGCAFMCGYPWSLRSNPPHLLAAPLPAPARYAGQPVYFTDFVVRADAPFRALEDTFGGRLAYSIDSSHSGYSAVRHHLLGYRTRSHPALYRDTVGPLVTPRRVLEAVVEGRADVGPLDSYLLDLWRLHQPGLVRDLRVIATTAPAPIPPLVASAGVDRDTCARLTAALLDSHRVAALAATLDALLLSGFASVLPAAFELFREHRRAAEQAAYTVLA